MTKKTAKGPVHKKIHRRISAVQREPDKAKPAVEKLSAGGDEASFSGRATTRVTFSAPGEYLLHVTANDYSGVGGGGFVCCWTTAMVKVTVQP